MAPNNLFYYVLLWNFTCSLSKNFFEPKVFFDTFDSARRQLEVFFNKEFYCIMPKTLKALMVKLTNREQHEPVTCLKLKRKLKSIHKNHRSSYRKYYSM